MENKIPQLDANDVINATNIMKAAIERNAFKAEELSGVCAVFDKYRAIADVVKQQAQQSQEVVQSSQENVEVQENEEPK